MPDPDHIETPELWGPQEIAEHLDVSRRTVYIWLEEVSFPDPMATLRSGRVWEAKLIRHWYAQRKR